MTAGCDTCMSMSVHEFGEFQSCVKATIWLGRASVIDTVILFAQRGPARISTPNSLQMYGPLPLGLFKVHHHHLLDTSSTHLLAH